MASVTGRRLGSVAVARWFTEGLYRPGVTGTGVLTQGRHFSVRFDADQDEVSDTIDSHLVSLLAPPSCRAIPTQFPFTA
jgi:hypothetical protein